MEQIDLLWEYQNLDILVDQCENQRKNSLLRNRLIELKNYLTEQQTKLMKLDEETEKKNNTLSRINHEYESIVSAVKSEKEKIEDAQIKTTKQLEQVRETTLELKDKLEKKAQELEKLLIDMDLTSRKLEVIRFNVTKGKKEYANVKLEYDKELEAIQREHAKAKSRRDSMRPDIDNALLEKYLFLKDKRNTAMAMITQDRCGGCNMTMASVVIQHLKEKKVMMECENCGRLLYAGVKKDASEDKLQDE